VRDRLAAIRLGPLGWQMGINQAPQFVVEKRGRHIDRTEGKSSVPRGQALSSELMYVLLGALIRSCDIGKRL
jgi:hypothetical protein